MTIKGQLQHVVISYTIKGQLQHLMMRSVNYSTLRSVLKIKGQLQHVAISSDN